jgi:SNF2 family DNA or RNA helicase
MTGTPLAENPLDVYAQYRFLDPSIFGTNYTAFRDQYENLDVEATARIGHRIRDKLEPFINLDRLHDKMFSCAFYIESTIKLPEVTDIEYTFKIPVKSQALYKEVVNEGIVELNDKIMETTNVLSLLLRLQQLTSGYLPAEDEEGNKKIINIDKARIETLKELLDEFDPAEPIVIFAVYTKDLKNIRKACKELGYSYSEVSGREDTLKDWKKGKTKVIGVQYSCGSESIDLTRARYCIYYSLTRRLSLYEQSRKRIHRPGQTRPVYYYHFIAKMKRGKTIDEKMYEALMQKKDIVKYVMKYGWK